MFFVLYYNESTISIIVMYSRLEKWLCHILNGMSVWIDDPVTL